jgi:hypothetical protein
MPIKMELLAIQNLDQLIRDLQDSPALRELAVEIEAVAQRARVRAANLGPVQLAAETCAGVVTREEIEALPPNLRGYIRAFWNESPSAHLLRDGRPDDDVADVSDPDEPRFFWELIEGDNPRGMRPYKLVVSGDSAEEVEAGAHAYLVAQWAITSRALDDGALTELAKRFAGSVVDEEHMEHAILGALEEYRDRLAPELRPAPTVRWYTRWRRRKDGTMAWVSDIGILLKEEPGGRSWKFETEAQLRAEWEEELRPAVGAVGIDKSIAEPRSSDQPAAPDLPTAFEQAIIAIGVETAQENQRRGNLGQPKPQLGPPVPRGHCNRCDRCGWEMVLEGATGAAGGCWPSNCSQRPMPEKRTTCAGCGAPFEPAPEGGAP